jgi:crotonobetainyl-CoA:carnitine CoA-transferase CaiB-like acyl-CoA transferase
MEPFRRLMVTIPERLPIDMNQLLARFPDDAALIALLLIQSDAFRNLCEDLILAKSTLDNLDKFQRQQQAAKIAEYRQLVTELEKEIADALEHAKQPT